MLLRGEKQKPLPSYWQKMEMKDACYPTVLLKIPYLRNSSVTSLLLLPVNWTKEKRPSSVLRKKETKTLNYV